MSFLDRLLGVEEPTVSVHAIGAAVGEYSRDQITAVQIQLAFNITTEEDIETLQIILDAVHPGMGAVTMTREELEDVLILGIEIDSTGVTYFSESKVKTRLGL